MRTSTVIVFVCAAIMLVLGLVSLAMGRGAPTQTLAGAAVFFAVGAALEGDHRKRRGGNPR